MKFEHLSRRYTGNRAEIYDAERASGRKWLKEQVIVENFLSRLERGTTVIDVPVGTCRFIEFYKKFGLKATGMDISNDMLSSAALKAQECAFELPLKKCDIRNIDAGAGEFDTAICIRFLNWIDYEGLTGVIAELVRVARRRLIIGVRTGVHGGVRKWLSVKGMKQFPAYMMYQLRNAGKKKELIYHEKSQIRELFERHGLSIVDQACVEERCDLTEYHIYFLNKDVA